MLIMRKIEKFNDWADWAHICEDDIQKDRKCRRASKSFNHTIIFVVCRTKKRQTKKRLIVDSIRVD